MRLSRGEKPLPDLTLAQLKESDQTSMLPKQVEIKSKDVGLVFTLPADPAVRRQPLFSVEEHKQVRKSQSFKKL